MHVDDNKEKNEREILPYECGYNQYIIEKESLSFNKQTLESINALS